LEGSKLSKEIIEIDLFQFYCLCAVIEKGDASLLKLSNGILQTKGCSNDYGCCAESVDVEQFVEDIKAQLPDGWDKAWNK
jgi:hypothetical protein